MWRRHSCLCCFSCHTNKLHTGKNACATVLTDNRLRSLTVLVTVATAVGCYYLWAVRAAGNPFYWRYDLGGYYDYLGRAFAHGQLHVPIQPSPELLAQPNPWDPAVNAAL